MNNNASFAGNNKNNNNNSSFFSRVFENDALKKGISAGVAGVLIAVVSEAIWPSDS